MGFLSNVFQLKSEEENDLYEESKKSRSYSAICLKKVKKIGFILLVEAPANPLPWLSNRMVRLTLRCTSST